MDAHTTGHTAVDHGRVRVLVGAERGAYPYANSLLVRGTESTVLIDPSLSLVGSQPPADLILVSHAHEDHMAGLADHSAPVRVHEHDLEGVRSPEKLIAGLGLAPEAVPAVEREYRERFHVRERPDATGFADGAVFDLGGCTVTVVHLPGHTAGHCGFLIEPDGFLFVADIDLSSFGPFYGDPGSSLTDFEASMRRCREIDARWYGTAHHKGVVEGAAEFRRRLDAYAGVVDRRSAVLLDLLAEPRTLEDVVAHRLVYRPHVEGPHVEPVERRTAVQHLELLMGRGRVVEVEPGRFRAADGGPAAPPPPPPAAGPAAGG